jgi:GNAT superfamily N-acetyltransferase
MKSSLDTELPMTFEIDDHYTFAKLDRENFPPRRSLPPGYTFSNRISRASERSLLEPEFNAWAIPFDRKMPGARADGVLCLTYREEPVAIVFLCDQNELGIPEYGQVHYAAIRKDHRGKGLYGPLFAELLEIGNRWGLRGVLLNDDRAGLSEVYRRWGAEFMFERPKSPQAPSTFLQRLARRLSRAKRRQHPTRQDA